MEEIRQLTPEEINEFCDETINKFNDGTRTCLCYALKKYLLSKSIYDLMDYNETSLFIPEFTNDNAVEYANAEKVYSNANTWWESYIYYFDYKNRILFLEWLKSQYPLTLKEE